MSPESPLDSKEIQPVHPRGTKSWIFIGRTDAEAETPILWPPDAKNWHWKRPWCWERLKAGGEGDDRGWDGWMTSLTCMSLSKLQELVMDREACCSPWGRKESDMTEQLNWTENCTLVIVFLYFLAMLDLYCCIGFSLIALRWKLLSSCSVWACHCGDLLLQSIGSTLVVCGLRCSVACGNLPGLGIKPVSPALAGRFFTTEPPGGPKIVRLGAAHLLSQCESSVIL